MFARSLARPTAALGLALVVAACSGATNPPATSGPSAAHGPSGAASSPASGGTGTDSYQGSITTSGLYAATWTAAQSAEVAPFNASSTLDLASDKNTYGNIGVKLDGSVAFGSAAPGLSNDGSYVGAGAHVTLDQTGAFVCAFTVDTDLKGSTDGAVLHMSGSMTAHWYSSGSADLVCP